MYYSFILMSFIIQSSIIYAFHNDYVITMLLFLYFIIWCQITAFKTGPVSIYLSIGINVRFAAMMADVGDGLL